MIRFLAVIISVFSCTIPFEIQANEKIDLKFDWPDGLVLEVNRKFKRVTTIPKKEEKITSESSFKWNVKKEKDKYLISFHDFEELKIEPPPVSQEPLVQLEYLSRKLEPILPTIIVDFNAQPIGLVNIDDIKKRIKDEYSKIKGEKDSQVEKFKLLHLDDDTLNKRSLQDWNKIAQIWSDDVKGVESGTTISIKNKEKVMGVLVEKTYTYTVKHGAVQDTVELSVVEVPEKFQSKIFLEMLNGGDFISTLGGDENSEIVIFTKYTTISNPHNLIPISYVKELTWGIKQKGKTELIGRTDTWSYKFEVIKNSK